jgi:hypothetical protein
MMGDVAQGRFAGRSERRPCRTEQSDPGAKPGDSFPARRPTGRDSHEAWRTTLSPVGPAAFWAAASADWAPFWALSTYWATSGDDGGVEAYDRRRAAWKRTERIIDMARSKRRKGEGPGEGREKGELVEERARAGRGAATEGRAGRDSGRPALRGAERNIIHGFV